METNGVIIGVKLGKPATSQNCVDGGTIRFAKNGISIRNHVGVSLRTEGNKL